MGIDDDTGLPEGGSENDIRGLSADARQGDQLFHRVRNLFTKALGHGFAAGDEMLRFIFEETGGTNELFEFRKMSRSQLCRLPIPSEERWSNLVDTLVGTLGGEDCGNEQLPRGAMVEFHLRAGHRALKRLRNLSETLPTIRGWQRLRYHGWYQNGLIVQRVKDEMQACASGLAISWKSRLLG